MTFETQIRSQTEPEDHYRESKSPAVVYLIHAVANARYDRYRLFASIDPVQVANGGMTRVREIVSHAEIHVVPRVFVASETKTGGVSPRAF